VAKTNQELAQEQLDSMGIQWKGAEMKPFSPSINPFNHNFRATVGSKLREWIDDSGIGGGYRQGLINAGEGIETAIDFTPIIGDAVGVGDTAQSIRQGDLLGTAINGGSVMLGAIPIAGDVLAKGLKNLTKEEINQGAMSSLREALNVPIERFEPLVGAPKYSGPLDPAGVDAPTARFAMVTAENPPNMSLTDSDNILRSEQLGEELIREYGPDNVSLVKGDYGSPERTYMVEGMDPIAAANIGNRYGQDSVFTDRGILYTSGSGRAGAREQISPLTGEYGQQIYKPNIDSELDSFYTEIQPKRGDPIRFSFPIDFNTKLEYPSGELAPASARGVHFSRAEGLTETDPARYGTGSAGAETGRVGEGRRAYGEGPLRTYFYTPQGSPSDVRPEAIVTGPNRYETKLRGLYDITSDPEGLVSFSKSPVDMERMIESRGYGGYLSDKLANPEMGRSGSAAVFNKQELGPTSPTSYQADTVAADPRAAGNPVAMRLNNKIANNFEGAIEQYSNIKRTKGGKVINADYAREISDDYKANKALASDVQAPSSEFARALYNKRLNESQGDEGLWVFTGGGTASGKSAGLSDAAENLADLVYDGTMKNFDKSDKMISEAAKSGKKVRIVYVDRDPDKALPLYFKRAESEGRTVPLDVFIDSHRGARDTIRKLSEKHANDPSVDIQIWSNQGSAGEQKLIDVSDLSDFNVDNVRPKLINMLEDYHAEGKISDAVYEATKASI
jgi:hypothetical protein